MPTGSPARLTDLGLGLATRQDPFSLGFPYECYGIHREDQTSFIVSAYWPDAETTGTHTDANVFMVTVATGPTICDRHHGE